MENSHTFLRSPLFNHLKRYTPKKSLLICSPYFKNYAFEQISKCYNLAEIESGFNLDILIRGKLEDFIYGSSDISVLETLIQLRITDLEKVMRVTNLHMKAYLIDEEHLLIGSGNCTKSGLFFNGRSGNIEGTIRTDDKDVIEEFSKYYKEVCTAGETLDSFYDTIVREYEFHAQKFGPKVGDKIADLLEVDESHAKYIIPSESGIAGGFSKNDSLTISVEDIPQFSTFSNGVYKLPEILLKEENRGMTFIELGKKLEGKNKKKGADKKYGENHAKLAELLDFVAITNDRPRKVFLTRLGERFLAMESKEKDEMLKTQVFRMRIVQDIIKKSSKPNFNINRYLSRFLAPSTIKRRRPNIKKLFKALNLFGITEVNQIITKL